MEVTMALSDEERKKRSDRMKAFHAAKKAGEPTEPAKVEEKPEEVSNEDVQALIARVRELETNFKNAEAQAQRAEFQGNMGVQVNNRGSLVGSFEKYILDPAAYPDPRERLSNEPKLQRFAFKINNDLEWDVTTTSYQTQDGINTKEPKFSLKLISIHTDENGEPNGDAHVIRGISMHEDPQSAIVIAREQGIEVGDDQKAFLDEMRYLQLRDWLLECFYPKPAEAAQKKRQEVIGNRVVEVFSTSGRDSQTIPFGDLKGKI
jgi:hypothetical protein